MRNDMRVFTSREVHTDGLYAICDEYHQWRRCYDEVGQLLKSPVTEETAVPVFVLHIWVDKWKGSVTPRILRGVSARAEGSKCGEMVVYEWKERDRSVGDCFYESDGRWELEQRETCGQRGTRR